MKLIRGVSIIGSIVVVSVICQSCLWWVLSDDVGYFELLGKMPGVIILYVVVGLLLAERVVRRVSGRFHKKE